MPSTPPRLADVAPGLTRNIVEFLRADPSDEALIEQFGVLPFMGRCPCGPGCRSILTAPPGSPAGYVVMLNLGEDPVIWLWFDEPTSRNITYIEILDDSLLSVAARRDANAILMHPDVKL